MSSLLRPRRCTPVAALPGEALPAIDGVVSDFDLRGDVVDRETGEVMGVSLLSVNGKYVARFKKYVKFGADQPRLDGTALNLSGEYTNKTKCRQVNPSDTTNITSSGDTPTVTNDAEALANGAGGWDFSVFGPNVFEASLPLAYQNCDVLGNTDNINPHSAFVILRVLSGSVTLKLGTTSTDTIANGSYIVASLENFTPSGTGNLIRIQSAESGTVVRFIMPQLTETVRNMDPAGNEEVGPVTFATEAGSADNGISYDEWFNAEMFATLTSEGRVRIICTPKWDKGDVTSAFGLITTTDGAASVVYFDASGNICTTDGTNTVTNTYAYTAGEELTIEPSWGDALNISVNGNAATSGSFDGAFANSGKMTFAWDLPDGFSLLVQRLTWYNREAA